MNDKKQMVFLIGAARSGTTLLGEQLLSNFHEVNYVGEKNWVWKYSNAYKQTDELTSNMLPVKTRNYIVDRFNHFSNKKTSRILIEKTPSNTLRLPLLVELFPDAKFIFLFREGGEVARSAALEWAGISKKALDSKRVRKASPMKRVMLLLQRESDFSDRIFDLQEMIELPYYFYRFIRNFLKINLKIKSFSWGPMNTEIDVFRKKNSLLHSCAYQWKICTERMLKAAANLPDESRLCLHFDDLKSSPNGVLEELLEFLKLPSDDALVQSLADKVKGGAKKEIVMDPDLLELISPVNSAVSVFLNKKE